MSGAAAGAAASSAASSSFLGRFVLDSSFIFRWCRRNPQVLAVTTTGVTCAGLYWRNVVRTEQRMLETQAAIAREAQQAVDDAVVRLNTLMAEWATDGEHKDVLLTKLHQQNIQQTRSLDRINTMLQMCRVEVPDLPSWGETRSARNSFGIPPAEQQLQQQPLSGGSISSSGANTPATTSVPAPETKPETVSAAVPAQETTSSTTTSDDAVLLPPPQQSAAEVVAMLSLQPALGPEQAGAAQSPAQTALPTAATTADVAPAVTAAPAVAESAPPQTAATPQATSPSAPTAAGDVPPNNNSS